LIHAAETRAVSSMFLYCGPWVLTSAKVNVVIGEPVAGLAAADELVPVDPAALVPVDAGALELVAAGALLLLAEPELELEPQADRTSANTNVTPTTAPNHRDLCFGAPMLLSAGICQTSCGRRADIRRRASGIRMEGTLGAGLFAGETFADGLWRFHEPLW
jgi:hypothetical protein